MTTVITITAIVMKISLMIYGCHLAVTITYLNCHSVSLATGTQVVFTAAKLFAIVIIVLGGMIRVVQGDTHNISKGFQGSKWTFSDIATSFYSGLWAYDGW